MKIAGIVAEYNPFHNGHAHHIQQTRVLDGGCEATHVVAVMSGNFVQRGEPALLPKIKRAEMALAGGADLVLELPLPWCLASAEGFAFGAVSLLNSLGCVDVLSFGSECGDIAVLEKAANTLESPRFSQLLHYYLEGGRPFAEARQKAAAEIGGGKVASLFSQANNTLGIEYIKAIRRLHSPMTCFTIPRFGAEHDALSPIGDMASASYIRALIRADHLLNATAYLPPASTALIGGAMQEGCCPASVNHMERALLGGLRTLPKEAWGTLAGVSEGLENRLYNAVRQAESYEGLLELVKTKRYPLTRLQRTIWSAYLGIPGDLEKTEPPYIRILAVNQKGRDILAAAQNASRPLLSRPAQIEALGAQAQQIWQLENKAADLYGLALPKISPCGTEYTNGVVRQV